MIVLPPIAENSSTPDPTRLRKHVAEFEGLLLSQILEKLKEAYHLPGEEQSDSAGESYQSLAGAALGNSLAAKGGLGITDMLVHSLTGNQKATPPVKTAGTTADVFGKVRAKD